MRAAVAATGISTEQALSRSRKKEYVFTRAIAMYLLYVYHELKYEAISALFGYHHSCIQRHVCRLHHARYYYQEVNNTITQAISFFKQS